MKSNGRLFPLRVRISVMTYLLFFFSVTGLAQFDTATVLGTVRDSNGIIPPSANQPQQATSV